MSSKSSIIPKRQRLYFAKSKKTSVVIDKSTSQPSFFLALPFELRMVIYDCLLLDFFKQGSGWYHTHPLYALLFVNQSLRNEVSDILYKSPSFKFASPHRCLFFLNWTASRIHRLRGLRISVPTHDTYSLEPIFDLLLKAQVPLEKLAFDFLNINSAAETPSREQMLPGMVGKEALRLARDRSDDLMCLFDRELDPSYEFCPSFAETAMGRAQCSSASSLGKLTTLRYLETDDEPVSYWAVEFELAILRLDARMFETAAKEGRKMIYRRFIFRTISYRVVDLRRRKGDEWKRRTKWYTGENIWADRRFGIEGTIMEEEEQLPRMGVRQVDEFTLCPQESRLSKALKMFGAKTTKLSSKEQEIQDFWGRLALNT